MDFWNKIKIDIQKGLQEGIGMVRGGVTIVKEKAEELTEEGKKRLKIFELKVKVQKEISELGGKVYALSSKLKNPLLDKKVKPIIARIKKLEGQIAGIEGKPRKASKKVTRKQMESSKTK